MENKAYKPRIIDKQIEEYLGIFGAICIEGPKWCGKTWSSSYHSNSEIMIGSPEGGFQNRRLAELSPEMVLEGDVPRLIDEWQEVPSLWDAVRYKVDQKPETGQFILTGSATQTLLCKVVLWCFSLSFVVEIREFCLYSTYCMVFQEILLSFCCHIHI